MVLKNTADGHEWARCLPRNAADVLEWTRYFR